MNNSVKLLKLFALSERVIKHVIAGRLTNVSSADGARVVDCKAAPSLTRRCHVLHVLHTPVVQSADVRERVATVL